MFKLSDNKSSVLFCSRNKEEKTVKANCEITQAIIDTDPEYRLGIKEKLL